MSNTIIIELCAEDRARLDRLAEAMEKRACDNRETTPLTIQPVEVPNNVPEEAKASTPTNTPTKEEETTVTEAEPTVDRAELRAKVIELSAKGLKEETRDIVRAYAQTVTAVPEDKLAECYAQLVALEGQR